MDNLPPSHTPLASGQTLFLHAASGTRIISARGSLSITRPGTWLGERMVSDEVLLNEGDSYFLRLGGWVGISARNDAEVVCTGHRQEAGIVMRLRSFFRSSWRSMVAHHRGPKD